MTAKQATRDERIAEHLESRMEDMRRFVKCDPEADRDEELNEYGLSLDWVEPDNKNPGGEPFVCWLLGTGGPHDEFRFYLTAGPHGSTCHRVEYRFMDWWDGAGRTLHGDDLKTMCDLWEAEFSECFQVSDHE